MHNNISIFPLRHKPCKYYIVLILAAIVYIPVFPKLCLGLSSGQIYNIEAQNIVNTADLLIKAEHAYFHSSGRFAGIVSLEQSNPAYLSPIPVDSFNNEQCLKKILFKTNIYVCINLQGEALEVFMPDDFAYLDIAANEISKGITGKTGQVSHYGGSAVISFDLNRNPPSFASNPNTRPSVISTLASPDANGGMSYTNTVNQSGLINKVMQAVAGFFTAVLSLF